MTGLRNRWIDLVNRTATGSNRKRTSFTPIDAGIFAALIAGFICLAIKTDRLFSFRRLCRRPL